MRGEGKVSKSLFEPLTLLELEAPKNRENRIGFIKEAKLHHAYTEIPFDFRKKALVFFLAEVIYQVVLEEQEPNQPLFKFVKQRLIWLDSERKLDLFHIKMMLDLTKYIGFYPNLLNPSFIYFDLESGSMSSVKPNSYYIKDPLKSYWTQLLGMDFDRVNEIKLLKKHRVELLNQVITYFELHLQQFKPPKSTEVLNEIFKIS